MAESKLIETVVTEDVAIPARSSNGAESILLEFKRRYDATFVNVCPAAIKSEIRSATHIAVSPRPGFSH